MSLELTLVPMGSVTQAVASIYPQLQKAAAITHGRSSVDDLVRAFYTGAYGLWLVFDTETQKIHGFLATEVKQYPQLRMLTIQHCVMESGTLKKIEDRMQELAQRYARDTGCAGIEFVGRPGWRRYSKVKGYHSQSVVYQQFFEVQP